MLQDDNPFLICIIDILIATHFTRSINFFFVNRWSLAQFRASLNIIIGRCGEIHEEVALVWLGNLKTQVRLQFGFKEKHDSEELNKNDAICKRCKLEVQ